MKLLYRLSFLITFALSTTPLQAASPVDCAGSPKEAIIELPEPLSEWGTLVCTPFGHVISNREGWIWSEPTAFAPVFIPSQMVRKSPEPLGNDSHFTSIEMTEVTGSEEASSAWQTLNKGFDDNDYPERAWRLEVTGSLGKSLELYFFSFPENPHLWAIWCPNGACSTDSSFMVLDMRAE